MILISSAISTTYLKHGHDGYVLGFKSQSLNHYTTPLPKPYN